MSDEAEQHGPGNGGGELGTLLALLHRGDAAFDRVTATFRTWRHTERSVAAHRAHIEEEKRRGAGVRTFGLGDREQPEETVELLRLWRDGDRMRTEHSGGWSDGAYTVRDREIWWTWNENSGATSNADDPAVGFGGGGEVSLMLDPTPLLGLLRFSPAGRGQVAGHETVSASALPRLHGAGPSRRSFDLHQLGIGAEHYLLEVDVRRGVLLDAIAVRDGEPFHRITAVEIAFDEPIPDERFVFVPPAGEEIQAMPHRRQVTRLTVTEVQSRASFTVLIPARIPPGWQSHGTFIEASDRPPSPPGAALFYRSDDGHESISLSEYAVGDQPSQYGLMGEDENWTTHRRNDVEVRFRSTGPQAQAYVELHGTFAFLTSESLSGERLAELAAGLKPAPDTPGI